MFIARIFVYLDASTRVPYYQACFLLLPEITTRHHCDHRFSHAGVISVAMVYAPRVVEYNLAATVLHHRCWSSWTRNCKSRDIGDGGGTSVTICA